MVFEQRVFILKIHTHRWKNIHKNIQRPMLIVKNIVVYTKGTITLQRMSRELLSWAPLKLCSRATKANNNFKFV